MVPRLRRARAAARGAFRYAGLSGAAGAPRAGGAGDAPASSPRAQAGRPLRGGGRVCSGPSRGEAARRLRAGPGRGSRRCGDAAGAAVPWQRRAEPRTAPARLSLAATFRPPCERGGGPRPRTDSAAAQWASGAAAARPAPLAAQPNQCCACQAAGRDFRCRGDGFVCVCESVSGACGVPAPPRRQRSGGPARPPRPPLRGGAERPRRPAAPSAGAEGGPPVRGPLRERGAPRGQRGPPRGRGAAPRRRWLRLFPRFSAPLAG